MFLSVKHQNHIWLQRGRRNMTSTMWINGNCIQLWFIWSSFFQIHILNVWFIKICPSETLCIILLQCCAQALSINLLFLFQGLFFNPSFFLLCSPLQFSHLPLVWEVSFDLPNAPHPHPYLQLCNLMDCHLMSQLPAAAALLRQNIIILKALQFTLPYSMQENIYKTSFFQLPYKLVFRQFNFIIKCIEMFKKWLKPNNLIRKSILLLFLWPIIKMFYLDVSLYYCWDKRSLCAILF